MDFIGLINRESETIETLRQNIHKTLKNRSKDRETWSRACKKFHTHVSAMSEFVNRIYKDHKIQDEETLEFCITFLEVDPFFFRSGYIKEEILTKIKRSDLSEKQIFRLRTILINAVEFRGSKEFKYYCRLAGFIANNELIDQLQQMTKKAESTKRYRAKKMLTTIMHSLPYNKQFKNGQLTAAL